jgi:monoamine oxidase
VDGVHVGDLPPWFTDRDVASMAVVEAAVGALVATVDPDDPWRHPDLVPLDAVSVGDWMRAQGATPAVLRLYELAALGAAGGSIERQSMFGHAWMLAVGGSSGDGPAGSYEYGQWENLRVTEGSARVPLLVAEGLGERVRLGTPVAALDVAPGGCTVITLDGELLRAAAVVCAVPVGPLRDIAVTGVSPDRLARLRRRRHAQAAKFVAAYPEPFWRDGGQNGLSENDGVLGSTWPQSVGILSALVPPERLAAFAATEPARRVDLALAEVARLYGDRALAPQASWVRMWGLDPWTQGYVAAWMPGDVAAAGPSHGSHEPPFYVAGSDHWVCGYMEGAVRTGRAAAAAVLATG